MEFGRISRRLLTLGLAVVLVLLAVVVTADPPASAADGDGAPPVLPACALPSTVAEWNLTSGSATGVLNPTSTPVGTDVIRGLRRDCAWQGDYRFFWHCEQVPGGQQCAWVTQEVPALLGPGGAGSASPALIPVRGDSRLVTLTMSGRTPTPWPQCLPVGVAPECGQPATGTELLVRIPAGDGTFTGRPWNRFTPVETLAYRFVRQGTCDGGQVTWRGVPTAVGTPSCTYLLKWNTDPATPPYLFSDLQLAVTKTWLRFGPPAVAVEGAEDLSDSSGISVIPMALDLNPVGVPMASMDAPIPFGPGEFMFVSTSTDSLGGVVVEDWDFGDPGSPTNTAQGRSATHTYTKPGTYTVTLRVRNLDGREATTTTSVTVAAPTLGLGVELLDGAAPPLDEDQPVGVKVTVSASSDGVGDLSDLTFDEAVLKVSPADSFTLLDGPTPEPPGDGLSLAPGASSSFVLNLQPSVAGRYTLLSKVTGTDAAGRAVEAEASSPGEIGAALKVDLEVDPPFADQAEGPDGPEPVDVTVTIKLTNTTDGPMTSVNLRSLRVDRTQPGQLLAVEQTGGVEPDPTDGFVVGTLAAGETRELTTMFRATDDAEVEFSALASGITSDNREVLGARKLRWSVKPKYLLGLTTWVTQPVGAALLPAGDPFTIRGTVKNLSTSATLELGPLFPELRGNAGVMTLTYNAVGGVPGTLAVPPKLVLEPAESMEFTLRVTTGWSDPRGTGDVAPHGGVRATATFTPWGRATLEDGTVVDIEDEQIKATEADLVRQISIDDSIPIPVTDPLALGGAILVGTGEGIASAIAAIAGGVVELVKLPYTAVVATSAYQQQVWDSFTDAEKADFVNDAGLMVAAVLARNAEFGKRDAALLYEQAKAVTLNSMTEMANDWAVGDYTRTAEMYSRFASDALAQVAVPIALAKLAKSPAAIAALKRAQEALQARMAPVLARFATLERLEEVGPVLDALANGVELTAEQTAVFYGIAPEELTELQNLATKYRFLLTVRSRHASSIEWIKRFGALLKPEVLKIKSVSELDAKLGYRAEDVGSLVFKKPVPLAQFDAQGGLLSDYVTAYLESKGFVPDTADWWKAFNRIMKRSQEWRKFENDYKFWSKRGYVDVSFNYKGNAIADTVRKGTGQYRGFRLRAIGEEEYVVEMLDNKTGRFVPITGDIDPIAFTHLDGSPLTAEEHAALLDDMRTNPLLQAQHGESATFVKGGTEFIESQFKPGEPGLEIGPGGGAPRVVRFNAEKSRWASPFDYHLQWDGGLVDASSTPRPASAPPPDLAAVGALPSTPATAGAPLALPGRPTDAGANVGRCRLSYANATSATPLYLNAQGEIVELVDGQPVPWAEGASCFQEGPIAEVSILPSTLMTGEPQLVAAAGGAGAMSTAGETHIPISDEPMYATVDGQSGFAVGQVIVINPGTPTAEVRTIVGFGSLVVDRPLDYAHEAGEVIVVIKAAPVVVPPGEPDPDPTSTTVVTPTPPPTTAATQPAPPGTPGGPNLPASPEPPTGGTLPVTGADSTGLLLVATALLSVGVLALWARRRRWRW